VVLVDDIVQVLAVAHQDVYPTAIVSWKLAQCPMTLLVTIQRDLARPSGRAGRNRLAEQGHRRSDSAPGLE
jgi:hypothetical protein